MVMALFVITILILTLLGRTTPATSGNPVAFLNSLRLSKYWPQFEALGVVEMEDFNLVTVEDLHDFGFKPVHRRKFQAAVEKLQPQEYTPVERRQQQHQHQHHHQHEHQQTNPSLSHATLLMKTKLRKMKIKTLRKHLQEGNDASISASNYRTEVIELRESLNALEQMAAQFGMSAAFQEGTIDHFEDAHANGVLAEYLIELVDLEELKKNLVFLDNPAILTVEALRNPIVLQNILNDQEERNHVRETAQKAAAAQEKAQKTTEAKSSCAPTADWRSCSSVGASGVASLAATTLISTSIKSKPSKFYSYQTFNDDTDENLRKAEAHFQLGHMLHQEGQLSAAKDEYRRCLAIAPTHVTANHMLHVVLSGESDGVHTAAVTYERAQPGYVEMLFDSYADTYDEHMVNKLMYRVPSLIVEEMVRQFIDGESLSPTAVLRVLDLGCGTGLVGKLWKEQNIDNQKMGRQKKMTHFVGVDMSFKMLALADEVYDRIVHGTIDEFFDTATSDLIFDAITIGDVFGYIGNVETILADASNVLSSIGRLLFTIEVSKTSLKKGYKLDVKTSRFVHDVNHIRHILGTVGMTVLIEKKVTLRYQMRMPVLGVLFVCEKY